MERKLIISLALIAILATIGPANGCKHCGSGWCSCGGGLSSLGGLQSLLPPFSGYQRSWDMDRSPIQLSLPLIQPSGSHCENCGGYNRGYRGYSSMEEPGYSRGYYCRCSPRRRRYRYDDY